jgi:hypothetical protein
MPGGLGLGRVPGIGSVVPRPTSGLIARRHQVERGTVEAVKAKARLVGPPRVDEHSTARPPRRRHVVDACAAVSMSALARYPLRWFHAPIDPMPSDRPASSARR